MVSSKKNLLLVEDEGVIALTEKFQLERYGYTVTLARNGEEAIARTILDESAFDAILMDINLGPGIDGTQAATRILDTKDIPIIFVSSHIEPEIVSKTENITSYGYVVKNSGIVVLDASIKMALKLFVEKTERRRAEDFQRLSAAVLGVLNEPQSLRATSHRILELIRGEFGVDAAGIRLKDENDFPYFCESGFAEDFLRTENSLLLRDETGMVCRDPDGRICLECTCGLVLSGLCGPPSDSVTAEGSLWTNDSLSTAEALHAADPRRNPRDRCCHDGYQSIALIPIRVGREIIGLLHLNDRRKDRFTPDIICFFEGLAASFGIAVERKRTEERLRQVEERFRLAIGGVGPYRPAGDGAMGVGPRPPVS